MMYLSDFESRCVVSNTRYTFDLLPHNLPAETPRVQVNIAAVAGAGVK